MLLGNFKVPLGSLLKLTVVIMTILMMQGCVDDLAPSNDDKRTSQSQSAENLVMTTTTGDTVELEQLLAENNGVVLYFTMWCPLCDSHMSHLSRKVIPEYPDIAFVMVDYVSSSTSQARRSQIENGYQSLAVVADVDQTITNQFRGTMASTIVIDTDGIVQLNEDYKNGDRLISVLEGL